MAAEVGERAPDFELQGTGDRTYRLADYEGTGVILLFYPADFTTVCTKQFCSYRDDEERIGDLGVPLLGISPQSVGTHEKFTAKFGLNVPLAADPEKEVAEAYGALARTGHFKRATVAIGGDLVVRDRHVARLGLTFQDADDLAEMAEKLRPAAA